MTATAETVNVESLRVAGERDDRYYTYPPTGERFVSVTTVTGGTSSKPWLATWHAKLAAEYAVDNIGDLAALVASGQRAQALAQIKQQANRIRDFKADVGSYVHSIVEALILWAASPEGAGAEIALPTLPEHLAGATYDDEPVENVADWMVTGFLNWVTDFSPLFEAAEMAVFNPDLKVAGTLDMAVILAGYKLGGDGQLCADPGGKLSICVDTKTGKQLENTMREQLAAYRRMPLALLPMGQIAAKPITEAGAVLHLRPEYGRGYRFMPVARRDDALAWNRFQRAVELWRGRQDAPGKPGKPAYPLRPDGTAQPRLLADLDGEGYGRVPGALAKAGIADLEALAALDEDGCRALKGIGPKAMPLIRDLLAAHGMHLRGEDLNGGN